MDDKMEQETSQETPQIDWKSQDYYFNRELSFIEFNKRVLSEAECKEHPLLERLKFVSIVSSNFDEFFMIRVAGLKDQITAGVVELSSDGMTPGRQLEEIRTRLIPVYQMQERILIEEILPSLKNEGIHIHQLSDLSESENDYLKNYFFDNVLPVLTPISLDPAHPFPSFINRTLNIAFAISDKSKKNIEKRIAFVQLPTFLPRFVPLENKELYHYVLMEQIIIAHAGILFPGLEIEASDTFRVTRDADIEIADDEAEDLLTEIAEQIKQRRWGTAVVRLEVNAGMPAFMVELLIKSLDINSNDVYMLNRPLNLPDFLELTKIDLRHLKDNPFQTRPLPEFQIDGVSVFDAIRKKDLMIHLPYDSFTNSVLKFINQAVDDPHVLAIKITLYRTGLNSPVVDALKRAAENGKEVTAFVELKARFDEENNIIWAKELEHVGVHVIYGVIGLKTHCKIAMVVRKETDKLKTYVHLSTGNYNHVTSRLYTDLSFFTADDIFGREAVHLFNYLTGYSYQKEWQKFFVAPINLRQKLLELINREADLHTPENPGLIFAKMNSLAHDEVTQALYRASQKGVQIKLLIRGICCLRPGIPEVSENIEVRSVIGRFLEHSRAFYFKNGGEKEFYLGSADWMTRNLHRRVELMFPVQDKNLQKTIHNILKVYWKDNVKSWRLLSDGTYERLSLLDGEERFSAQEHFLEESQKSRQKVRNSFKLKF